MNTEMLDKLTLTLKPPLEGVVFPLKMVCPVLLSCSVFETSLLSSIGSVLIDSIGLVRSNYVKWSNSALYIKELC